MADELQELLDRVDSATSKVSKSPVLEPITDFAELNRVTGGGGNRTMSARYRGVLGGVEDLTDAERGDLADEFDAGLPAVEDSELIRSAVDDATEDHEFDPVAYALQNRQDPESYKIAQEVYWRRKNQGWADKTGRAFKNAPRTIGGAAHGLWSLVKGIPQSLVHLGEQAGSAIVGDPNAATRSAETVLAAQKAGLTLDQLKTMATGINPTMGAADFFIRKPDGEIDPEQLDYYGNRTGLFTGLIRDYVKTFPNRNPDLYAGDVSMAVNSAVAKLRKGEKLTDTEREHFDAMVWGLNQLAGESERLAEWQKRQEFDFDVNQAAKQQQIAQGVPLNEGMVADYIRWRGEGRDPSELYGPQNLGMMGAEPVDPKTVENLGAVADPTTIALLKAPVLPGAGRIGGAVVEAGGRAVQGIGQLGKLIPRGNFGKGMMAGALTGGNPAMAVGLALASAGAYGLRKIGEVGKAIAEAGRMARTGGKVASAATTRLAEARLTGKSAKLDWLTNATGNLATNSAAMVPGMAPVNAAMAGFLPGGRDPDLEHFVEAEIGAPVFGLLSVGTGIKPQLVEAIRPQLRSRGLKAMAENDSAFGKKSRDFLSRLNERDRNAIYETAGLFEGMKGEGSQVKIHVLSGADYAAAQKAIEGIEGVSRGFAKNGEVYINGESPSNLSGGISHTVGHEVGGHAALDILRAMSGKGGNLYEGLMENVRAELGSTKNGKWTPSKQTQRFIDEYNAKLPQGANKIDAEKGLEEFLSETAGQVMANKGASELAMPEGLRDKLQTASGRFFGKLLGLNSRQMGGKAAFSREESLAVTSAYMDAMRRIADLRFRPQDADDLSYSPTDPAAPSDQAPATEAATTTAAPALSPLREKVRDALLALGFKKGEADSRMAAAEGDTESDLLRSALGGKKGPTAESEAPATPEVTPKAPEIAPEAPPAPEIEPPAVETPTEPETAPVEPIEPQRRRLSEIEPVEPGVDDAEIAAESDRQIIERTNPGPNRDEAFRLREQAKKRIAQPKIKPSEIAPVAPEETGPDVIGKLTPDKIEPIEETGTVAVEEAPRTIEVEPQSERVRTSKVSVLTPEDISTRVAEAGEKAASEAGPRVTEKGKEKRKKEARATALMEMASESAQAPEDLQARTEYGETKYTGRIDFENPVHRAVLDEFAVPDNARDVIGTLQDARGQTVFLDYNSAAKEVLSETAGQERATDKSGKQRAKEYAQSSAQERIAGTGETTEHNKAFVPLSTRINPNTGSVTVTGFSPQRLLSNAKKIIDFLQAEKVKIGYKDINDPKFTEDAQTYAENNENGWEGDGSKPIAGARVNPEYQPKSIPKDRFDLLNMAFADERAIKAQSKRASTRLKAEEAQRRAREQGKEISDTGEVNPLRDFINKSGKFQFQNEAGETRSGSGEILEPVIETLRPELVNNIRFDQPAESSIRATGFTGDLTALAKRGLPKAKNVGAGFLPETAEFKRWFGESKTVDDNGKPRILYHGTSKGGFNQFIPSGGKKNESLSFGVHFWADKTLAERYSSDPDVARKGGKKPQVYEAYVSLKNPIDAERIVKEGEPEFDLAKKIAGRNFISMKDENGTPQAYIKNNIDSGSPERAMRLLKEAGYDGVRYVGDIAQLTAYGSKNVTGKGEAFIAFEPTQIKSATGNSGAFDPTNPDIRFLPESNLKPSDIQPIEPSKEKIIINGTPRIILRDSEGKFAPKSATSKVSKLEEIEPITEGGADFLPEEKRVTEQQRAKNLQKWAGRGVDILEDPLGYDFEPGKPIVAKLYHGSTHYFTQFDAANQRANAENHFGRGNYFTDSKTDVSENYAGEGPDLTSRLERRAEHIHDETRGMNEAELMDQFDITEQQAGLVKNTPKYGTPEYEQRHDLLKDLARKELHGGADQVYPVYVKMKNPAIIQEDGGTRFESEGKWDDEGETYTENPESSGYKMLEAIRSVADENGLDGGQVVAEVMENFGEIDGVTAYDLEKAMRKSEALMYAEDPNDGSLISSELIGQMFRRAGFDGIIMDADAAFGSARKTGKAMEMDYGTKHYIVWEPEQIKSAIGNKGTFDPKNPDMRFLPETGKAGHSEERKRLVNAAAKAAGFRHRLYHGTDASRNVFEGGLFFTDSARDASAYAEMKALERAVDGNDKLAEIVSEIMAEEGMEAITDMGPKLIREIADANGIDLEAPEGHIMEAYVKADNPLDLTEFGSDVGNVSKLWDALHKKGLLDEPWAKLDEEAQQEVEEQYRNKALYRFLEEEGIQAKAFKSGYDAVKFTDISPDGGATHTSWLVKDNNQYKSAEDFTFDDQGREIPLAKRFDKTTQDVRYLPEFYSQLERVAKEKIKGRASADQIRATLRNNGVKQDEIDWVLGDLLEAKKGGQITPQELADAVAANKVELKEVEKSDEVAKKTLSPDVSIEQNEKGEWILVSNTGEEGPFESKQEAENFGIQYGYTEADSARSDQSPKTKFAQYQLPGGRNYRELLFTLPERSNQDTPEKVRHPSKPGWALQYPNGDYVFSKDGGATTDRTSDPEKASHWDREDLIKHGLIAHDKGQFRSSHFEEPNIIFHARVNDRQTADGRAMLFAEEVQSDWHQKGRKEGYKQPPFKPEDLKLIDDHKAAAGLHIYTYELPSGERVGSFMIEQGKPESEARQQAFDRVSRQELSLPNKPGVPDAPFKNEGWKRLAIKKLLARAVAEGKEAVGWTTGEQQAERYDLSKQVDRVQWDEKRQRLWAFNKGSQVINQPGVTKDNLADYIGKEAAQKLIEQEPREHTSGEHDYYTREISGEDLKVEAKGMKGFYDRELVNIANDIGKRYGARVEKSKLSESGFTEDSIGEGRELEGEDVDNGQNGSYGIEVPKGLKDGPEYVDMATYEDGTIELNVGGNVRFSKRATTQEAIDWLNQEYTNELSPEVWTLPITPALKAAIEKGQALFLPESGQKTETSKKQRLQDIQPVGTLDEDEPLLISR